MLYKKKKYMLNLGLSGLAEMVMSTVGYIQNLIVILFSKYFFFPSTSLKKILDSLSFFKLFLEGEIVIKF